MPNGRSGGYAVNTRRLIAALTQLDTQALVGPHYGDRDFGKPITVAVMLAAAEYTAQPSLVVEEQYGAWFIVRLPDFWVTVKEDSPLFEGLVQAIKQSYENRQTPSEDIPRPIEHCYWVSPGKFLAGEYPGALDPAIAGKRIEALKECGVEVTLMFTLEFLDFLYLESTRTRSADITQVFLELGISMMTATLILHLGLHKKTTTDSPTLGVPSLSPVPPA